MTAKVKIKPRHLRDHLFTEPLWFSQYQVRTTAHVQLCHSMSLFCPVHPNSAYYRELEDSPGHIWDIEDKQNYTCVMLVVIQCQQWLQRSKGDMKMGNLQLMEAILTVFGGICLTYFLSSWLQGEKLGILPRQFKMGRRRKEILISLF